MGFYPHNSRKLVAHGKDAHPKFRVLEVAGQKTLSYGLQTFDNILIVRVEPYGTLGQE